MKFLNYVIFVNLLWIFTVAGQDAVMSVDIDVSVPGIQTTVAGTAGQTFILEIRASTMSDVNAYSLNLQFDTSLMVFVDGDADYGLSGEKNLLVKDSSGSIVGMVQVDPTADNIINIFYSRGDDFEANGDGLLGILQFTSAPEMATGDSTEFIITSGEVVNNASHITVIADLNSGVFYIPVPTYSTTYNGNGNTGGVVPTDGSSYEEGAIVTVLGNTGNLVKTGFVFTNWNTASDGSGTTYNGGQTFTMGTADVALHAIWTIVNNIITVTQNPNGTIEPAGNVNGQVMVPYGTDQTFTITPAANYKIATLTVDGSPVTVASTYTFTNVTVPHTITAMFDVTTAILMKQRQLPKSFNLSANLASIRYAVPLVNGINGVDIDIRLFDVKGKLVANPVNGIVKAGCYSIRLNEGGLLAATGTYFCIMKAGSHFKKTMKMQLVR